MMQTNLSTRPFYNERLVHAVLLLLVLVVAGATIANVATIVSLSRKDAALGGATEDAERKAAEARRNADRVRSAMNPDELETVSAAAREANGLIDRRTFSWTKLLAEFEATLPAEVRLVSVLPTIDRQGQITIDLGVISRRAEDVNEFAEKLEARGAFEDLLLRAENLSEEGFLETTLSGRYTGKARQPASGR